MSPDRSREDLLSIARSIAPKGIEVVDITHVKDNVFSIKLRSKFALGEMGSTFWSPTHQIPSSTEPVGMLAETQKLVKKEIENKINAFVEHYYDLAETNLGSREYLKQRYRETDIIYRVPRYHTVTKTPNVVHRRNLDHWYSTVANNNIPCFGPLWEMLALGRSSHGQREALFEFMHGALERYKQALLAMDIISDLLQIEPDNDVVFLVNFHFYYFITVMKALGDNLAWILNYFYHLGLESDPKHIDLTSTRFKTALSRKSKELCEKICQGSGYERYVDLTKFRDIVVHRHALHVLIVRFGVNGPKKIMVPIDPATGVMIPGLGRPRSKRKSVTRADRESIAKYGLKEMLVALVPEKDLDYRPVDEFCREHLKFISSSYSRVLEHILSNGKASGPASRSSLPN